MSKKPVIVFEGVEGSGKSHHISVVSKYLKKNKIDHIRIREPGGNPNNCINLRFVSITFSEENLSFNSGDVVTQIG